MKQSIPFLALVFFISACSSSESLSPGFAGDINEDSELYNTIVENPFINVLDSATSTFSIDADGGSYLNCMDMIEGGTLPPSDAIRTEEFINYFKYSPLSESSAHPIASSGEIAKCPWNTDNQLVFLKMSGNDIQKEQLPASNFVFLIDVSGSMSSADKLELIKSGLKKLRAQLKPSDKLAIVTYAGNDQIVLNPTNCSEQKEIEKAIDCLSSGGGTNGAKGITTAYELANENFVAGGNNRIVLCSDGDFNVGMTSQTELIELIEEKRKSGVYLTTVGVGRGNLNDATMEQLANNGNGNYEYIGNEQDAVRIFESDVKRFYTIAEDVKVQITFNPNMVESYRLIGYENRVLSSQDFTDDTKDAGDLAVAQTVVAIYEIVPTAMIANKREPSFNFLIRYKKPLTDNSIEIALDVENQAIEFKDASSDLQFAAGLSAFAMVLRDSPYKGLADYTNVKDWVENANLSTDAAEASRLIDAIRTASDL